MNKRLAVVAFVFFALAWGAALVKGDIVTGLALTGMLWLILAALEGTGNERGRE